MLYNPALDGLRAVAIFAVVMFHARAPAALGGFIGVDVFFVLSGYLITGLLLAEVDKTGRVDLSRFYLRRFWRLTPGLALMLGVYVLVAPLAWPLITDHVRQATVAALYLSDYAVALYGTPNLLGHTWSLAIEAHFYLLWPLLIVAACRRWERRSLVIVLAVAYAIATLWRSTCVVTGQEWREVYYRFDTHLSGLVLGTWIAAAMRDGGTKALLNRAAPWLLWLPVAAIICLQYRWDDIWMLMYGLPIAELATLAVLVAMQAPDGQISAMLSRPSLVWLGRMSYSVYLWHYPIFHYLREVYHWETVLMIGVPLSVALAAASFYSLEAWARNRGRMISARSVT